MLRNPPRSPGPGSGRRLPRLRARALLGARPVLPPLRRRRRRRTRRTALPPRAHLPVRLPRRAPVSADLLALIATAPTVLVPGPWHKSWFPLLMLIAFLLAHRLAGRPRRRLAFAGGLIVGIGAIFRLDIGMFTGVLVAASLVTVARTHTDGPRRSWASFPRSSQAFSARSPPPAPRSLSREDSCRRSLSSSTNTSTPRALSTASIPRLPAFHRSPNAFGNFPTTSFRADDLAVDGLGSASRHRCSHPVATRALRTVGPSPPVPGMGVHLCRRTVPARPLASSPERTAALDHDRHLAPPRGGRVSIVARAGGIEKGSSVALGTCSPSSSLAGSSSTTSSAPASTATTPVPSACDSDLTNRPASATPHSRFDPWIAEEYRGILEFVAHF